MDRNVSYASRLPLGVDGASFDLSADFPALNRSQPPDSFSMHNLNQHNNFAIQSEDFPALGEGRSVNQQAYYTQQMNLESHRKPIGESRPPVPEHAFNNEQLSGIPGFDSSQGKSPPVTIHKSIPLLKGGAPSPALKKKSSLPPEQQFGLLGLLSLIRMEEPDRGTLALGIDLTSLGLNLNSSESLHTSFTSPWVDRNASKEPQFQIPSCYAIKGSTTSLKASQFPRLALETLFYIFYAMPKDTFQMLAAQELYNRDWKYHMEYKVWFLQQLSEGSNQYMYFDVQQWEKRPFKNANIAGNIETGFMNANAIFIEAP